MPGKKWISGTTCSWNVAKGLKYFIEEINYKKEAPPKKMFNLLAEVPGVDWKVTYNSYTLLSKF